MPRAAPDTHLARTIRELREAQGLSQEALAHRAGTTLGNLGRIEQARTMPSWGTVRDIAGALGITLADLARQVEARS